MEKVDIMKISVIMLTYNRENLVARAIESLLAQTLTDFEFIIIDNGSTDRSGKIADEYSARDGRIRVCHRDRGAIGAGRNTGLNLAQGEYIAFIDDDDIVSPDFLNFLYQLALEKNADVSICGSNFLLNDIKLVMNAEEAIITLMWRKLYNNAFPTKLIKRSLFNNVRFDEHARYDDVGLMYRILAKAVIIAYHGLPKYTFFRHGHNNSIATEKDCMITSEYLHDYRTAYHDRMLWLCKKFPESSGYWRYFNWSFQVSMVHKITDNHLRGCEEHLREMRYELAKNQVEFLNCPWVQDFEKEYMRKYISQLPS